MENLEPDIDLISLANAAYDSMYNYSKFINIVGVTITWDELDDKDKYIYIILTKFIINGDKKKVEPQDLHKFWLKMMNDNKWKYNEENNVYRKWNCHMLKWTDLPNKEKNLWKLFLAIVISLEVIFEEV